MSTIRNPTTAKPNKVRKGKALAKPTIDHNAASPALAVGTTKPAATTDATTKSLSGLAAAALVLREAGEPLDAQTLFARILERGLWKTGGKTPAATIYAAMIREIKAKGSDSRFQKVDRGRFAAAN